MQNCTELTLITNELADEVITGRKDINLSVICIAARCNQCVLFAPLTPASRD